MAKPKRIPVYVSEDQLKIIHKLMKQENRSRDFIASMVFSDGLKLVDNSAEYERMMEAK